MSLLVLDAAGATHPGLVRGNNEDALLVRTERGVFAVADGMGGAPCGEVASTLAVAEVNMALYAVEDPVNEMRKAFARANEQVLEAGQDPRCRGLGAALVAARLVGMEAWVGHAGDCRAYLLHRGTIRQLTKDHAAGHRLLRAVGIVPSLRPDIVRVSLEVGDTLLLCSDGLTNAASVSTVQRLLGTAPAQQTADLLVDAALRGGGPDNVTVVVVRVGIA